VYPSHDDVVLALADRRTDVDAIVVSSPPRTCQIVRFKRATYAHLSSSVRVPEEYATLDSIDHFPVFVKPDRGQGSQGAVKVASRAHLDWLVLDRAGTWDLMARDHLCLEYLPGPEYTVDCFSDRETGLLFVGARERLRVRNGIAVTSRVVAEDEFRPMAMAINARLELHGGWFFQAKRSTDGQLVLLEVAPRIAGSSGLTRARGVNLPVLSLYEQLRRPVAILTNPGPEVADRALESRFRPAAEFRRVYLDLDDTLIRGGAVDTTVVRFVFQCVNRGVEIVLLTRHRGHLAKTLDHHRLSGLFDRVIHLDDASEKADAIDPFGSIFVDDSFSERERIANRFGIATYDPSMLEALLDG
jgi:carbamoyl-phosphate synthase large subunit